MRLMLAQASTIFVVWIDLIVIEIHLPNIKFLLFLDLYDLFIGKIMRNYGNWMCN